MFYNAEICSTSSDIARAFNGLYEGSGRHFEMCSGTNLSKRKELRDEILPKLCGETNDNVVEELEKWSGDLDALQIRMHEREEVRVRFDHYARKLQRREM